MKMLEKPSKENICGFVTTTAYERLKRENAKLRKLCLDMGICMREGEWDCSDCPRYVKCNGDVSEFIKRMHELEIEVDE